MNQFFERPKKLYLRNQLLRTLLLGGAFAVVLGLEFIKYISFEDVKT